MGIKTQKVLRLISKTVLVLVGVGLIGIAGYYVYKSIAFKPQNVVVTNITNGSATVTWTTSSPMRGIVYTNKDKGLLPGPLGIVGSTIAYDDRDVSKAQKDCVDAFNKKASESKDAEFRVSGDSFDCESAQVSKTGDYYTHSVTMINLDENSTYNFVVGDGIWSFKEGVSTVKTFSVLDTVGEPMPVFGRVIGDDDTYSDDGLVYITFNDGSESKDSIVYSSTTNDDGGWYVDASNARDANGNVIPLELTNDSFKVKGVYKNYGSSDEQMWVLGYFNGAYPDIVVEKNIPISMLVMGAYASCDYQEVSDAAHQEGASLPQGCSATELAANASELGYGNVTRLLNALNSGDAIKTTQQIYGTSSAMSVAANTNAVYGTNLSGDASNVTVSNADTRTPTIVATGTNEDGKTFTQTCQANGGCVTETSTSEGKQKIGSSSAEHSNKQKVGTSTAVYEYYTLGYDAETSTYTIQTNNGKVTNIPSSVVGNLVKSDGDSRLALIPVELYSLIVRSGLDITSIVEKNEALKDTIQKELNRLKEENSKESLQQVEDICRTMGGGDLCPNPVMQSNLLGVSNVYASDSSSNESSVLYLPEYGMYSFELGDYTMSEEVSDGKTIYLFYIEANGEDGFQMPVNPDNPTSEEDIILDSSAYQITYNHQSTAQQYEIKKGINIIAFNFVPISTEQGAYTAENVIAQAQDNGVEIQYISTFDGGRWNNGYSCSSDTCTGNNFTIVPGRGYLVYATQNGTVTIPGYNLTSSIPVAFSAGWNLVGINGYTTAYTARSFIDSVNQVDGLTANNVSWWPTSKSKYEGLQVENGTEYGLDFSMSPTNGYFVRISKFASVDTKCKSLIWNPGTTLNGTCGNIK